MRAGDTSALALVRPLSIPVSCCGKTPLCTTLARKIVMITSSNGCSAIMRGWRNEKSSARRYTFNMPA